MHDFYKEYVSSGQSGGRAAGAQFDSGQLYLRRLIRRVGLGDRNVPIIDAACGSGALVGLLAAAGHTRVTGVDLSAEQIAAGVARGTPGLVCANVFDVLEKTPDGSVGAVFALNFLEHLELDEAVRFLKAVSRCLHSDGFLVLHIPNGQSPFCDAVRYADVTHTRAFTRRSLEQLFFASDLRLDWLEEGRPIVHGAISLARRIIWSVGRAMVSVWFAAETGAFPDALTQNITVLARPRR